jgi:uncharacterized protein (TIGR02271 family)
MSRTLHALFDSQSEAEAARTRLIQRGVPENQIDIARHSPSATDGGAGTSRGLWAKIKDAFLPGEDRATYEEGMRRGACLLVAYVDDDRADEATMILEQSNPVDLDTREQEWRSAGWAPQGAAAEAGAVTEERIPVVEERLQVGKREVGRGGVRVRSYIVEQPVHEELELRDERVDVERRPIGERVVGAPGELLQEREIEMTETREEPVIAKEAVVTDEVVVRKRGGKRVEKIDDTVRRTEVDVQNRSGADGVGQARQSRRPGDAGRRSPQPPRQ